MKETVSKTAKKTSSSATSAARKSGAAPALPATKAKAKATPASRPASKAAVAKPAAKATKPVVKAAKPAVKAVAKPAAKPAAKAAPLKAAAAKAAKPAAAAGTPARAVKAATAAKAAAAPKTSNRSTAAKAARAPAKEVPALSGTGSEQAADTGARTLGVPGVIAELADKMKTPVVSKVPEVMTKTTKPNSAAQTEDRILTEDEIRAMSDEDYMNPAQLAFFKAKLQALEKELLKNAGETTEHLRETVLVPDPADRATIEEEHALELRTRDRERKLLKKVQQSLASIDAGEYGWCEETGEPIGIPRLIARPTATLSLEAQQRRELKQKLYGD
jgi:DnaK suppressor protein